MSILQPLLPWSSVTRHITGLLTGLLMLSGAAFAAESPTYKIEVIGKKGDQVGPNLTLRDITPINGTLNDSGQAVFLTKATGGQVLLVQYGDSKLTPIAVQGQPTPDGKGKYSGNLYVPVQMNQGGDIVFGAGVSLSGGGNVVNNAYLWDYAAQKTTLLLDKDIPGPNGIEFTAGSGWHPVINKNGEIALAVPMKNAAGQVRFGAFFRDKDHNLRSIVLPDSDLPDGGKVGDAAVFSLNDAGMVTFVTAPPGSTVFGPPQGFQNTSAYLWDNGTITPVAVVGQKLADGSGVIVTVSGAWLNERNRSVLVALESSSTGRYGLYRFAEGKLDPVVVPGTKLPDGLTFLTIDGPQLPGALRWVSNGNKAGQHAFAAQPTTGFPVLYLLEADGSLSVVLKPGTVLSLGSIDFDPNGIGLNNKGQISVPVVVLPPNDNDPPYAGVGVLTPVTPSPGTGG